MNLRKLINTGFGFIKENFRWWFLIILTILIVIGIVFVYRFQFGYKYWADGTGFGDKTIWDWLELLVIPIVLGLGAYYLNHEEKKNELALALSRFQETALQQFYEGMHNLILHESLSTAPENSDVIKVAYSRTLTTLRQLNEERKVELLQFLIDTGLIYGKSRNLKLDRANLGNIILKDMRLLNASLYKANLQEADISGTDFHEADLMMVNFSGAQLTDADFTNSDLTKANCSNAKLKGAKFHWANCYKADFQGASLENADFSLANLQFANFENARISQEQITKARLYDGVILPSGEIIRREDDYILPREGRLSVQVLREFISAIDRDSGIFLSFSNRFREGLLAENLEQNGPYSLRLSQSMSSYYLTIHDKQYNEVGLFIHSNIDIQTERNFFEEFRSDYLYTLVTILGKRFTNKFDATALRNSSEDFFFLEIPYRSVDIPERLLELSNDFVMGET